MTIVHGWVGRYFEDFTVGDIYRSRLGRTITNVDNIWFTCITNTRSVMVWKRAHAPNRATFPEPRV